MTSLYQMETGVFIGGKYVSSKTNDSLSTLLLCMSTSLSQQPYHPVAQDWLPTEAKQG